MLPERVVYLTLVMGPLLRLTCRHSLLQERLDGVARNKDPKVACTPPLPLAVKEILDREV